MKCPKCGFENSSDREDCLRCRVIFAKIRQSQASKVPDLKGDSTEARGIKWTALLFSDSGQAGVWGLWGRAAALVVMAIWGGKLAFSGIAGNAAGESWLHLINLPFHEAGHLFFRPLGRFMTSLGGTLGQLLIPLVCLTALLLKTRDPFGGEKSLKVPGLHI